jgi:hypothetical protein
VGGEGLLEEDMVEDILNSFADSSGKIVLFN